MALAWQPAEADAWGSPADAPDTAALWPDPGVAACLVGLGLGVTAFLVGIGVTRVRAGFGLGVTRFWAGSARGVQVRPTGHRRCRILPG